MLNLQMKFLLTEFKMLKQYIYSKKITSQCGKIHADGNNCFSFPVSQKSLNCSMHSTNGQ